LVDLRALSQLKSAKRLLCGARAPLVQRKGHRGKKMTWDEKCWGIFSNIYWTTRFIGMRGSKVTPELAQLLTEHNIALPKRGGQIYVREDSESELSKKLVGQEEILNHFFNITFDIACDDVISRLLCQPLGIADKGPFASLSRGFQSRYGWGKTKTSLNQMRSSIPKNH
jgi:hypothetical protein